MNVFYIKLYGFWFLHSKPCRIMWELRQSNIFGTERNLMNSWNLVMSKLIVDGINKETHKGKYMEHIWEIYMEYIRNI